jgi:hypothetical protein
LASDGTSGLVIAATIGAFAVALFMALVSLAFLRGRVITEPGQLAVVGLFTTKQVPSDKIERVLFRTISYSGNSVREVLVVGDRGQILCRVAASFYADDDLRALFSGLGFLPQGSWSNVIALGPIEGLSAEESLASKLRSDDSP